jgi:hypothetical protein
MRELEEIRAEQAVRAMLPAPVAERIVADTLFSRLAWQLHLAELDGIDPVEVLRELEDGLSVRLVPGSTNRGSSRWPGCPGSLWVACTGTGLGADLSCASDTRVHRCVI